VTNQTVTFAQVAAFDGPAAALGTGMRLGITAALVKTIVSENNYIGLIGPVGTPTTAATQPIARQAAMPLSGL